MMVMNQLFKLVEVLLWELDFPLSYIHRQFFYCKILFLAGEKGFKLIECEFYS